ncbi:MAG TPA: Wadjet anti-phage system protein JetD domain-containing protein [Nocardioides sp.]|nr:Wadjet anti-phage system protein JetD domain-containing protein [Nocardioides sp.]
MRTPGLKSPAQTVDDVRKRLAAHWAAVLCGSADWNPVVNLGTSNLKGPRLRETWSAIHLDTLDWIDWARAAGEGVRLELRRVSYAKGNEQDIAASLRVESVDAAARLLGDEWPARLDRARRRRDALDRQFPELVGVERVLRAVDAWGEADFDVLCRAARWFAANPRSGLTARQVDVEGMGSKWLAGRAGVVRQLAGLDDLGLVPGRPRRVHVTYLDPEHLAAGGRRHDVVTEHDADVIAYRPRVVLVSENRDTAQLFPDVVGGIAVEGDGNGPGLVPDIGWLREAEVVWYWGDMDAKGLEILASFRARGVAARSLFMDIEAYRRWERYGVDVDEHGKPIVAHPPKQLSLEPGERELYEGLCSDGWTGHRRVEQERIPLDEAAAIIRGVPGAARHTSDQAEAR